MLSHCLTRPLIHCLRHSLTHTLRHPLTHTHYGITLSNTSSLHTSHRRTQHVFNNTSAIKTTHYGEQIGCTTGPRSRSYPLLSSYIYYYTQRSISSESSHLTHPFFFSSTNRSSVSSYILTPSYPRCLLTLSHLPSTLSHLLTH